ncbi:MAG: hypothetical protein IIT35_06520, partial [Oscillospiraceae bacterium]|nr:hypothetical protein [Oscillospiraceae bacterium]
FIFVWTWDYSALTLYWRLLENGKIKAAKRVAFGYRDDDYCFLLVSFLSTIAELFVKKQKLRLAAGRSFCMQWCVDQNLAICSGVMEVTVATASLTVSSKS